VVTSRDRSEGKSRGTYLLWVPQGISSPIKLLQASLSHVRIELRSGLDRSVAYRIDIRRCSDILLTPTVGRHYSGCGREDLGGELEHKMNHATKYRSG
jgi:hypothetical protein